VDELPEDREFWREHPDPSDADIAMVCRAWLRYQGGSPRVEVDDQHPDWWAPEALNELGYPPVPELEWKIIRCLCKLVDPAATSTISMIGASPLEDFLMRNGDRAMDLVEPAADEDPVFMEALTSVWGFGESVRRRIDRYLASRGQEPR